MRLDYDTAQEFKSINFARVGYVPLPIQLPIHASPHRVILVSGGEGSGKSYVTAAEIFGSISFVYPILVHVVAPKYESAHKEMDYLYQWLLSIGATRPDLYRSPATGKRSLDTVTGDHIETISSEDGPKAITGTGESPDIVALVEAGKQSYAVHLAARARVARSRGREILSGTIEESERWYPELIERWLAPNTDDAQAFIIPTWENTILYPGGEADPEILAMKSLYTPEKFMERFGATPVTPSNVVFPQFKFVTHVQSALYWASGTNGEYWRKQPVSLAIDPGYAGAYSVQAIQVLGDQVYVIDEVYHQFKVVEDVIEECMHRPWWNNATDGVMDVAGRQHHAQKSQLEIWAKNAVKKDGSTVRLQTMGVPITEGIRRLRTFLVNPFDGAPRIFYDPRCINTCREFGLYRYPIKKEGEPVSEIPVDANNHSCKGMAYWLVAKFGLTDSRIQRLPQDTGDGGFFDDAQRRAWNRERTPEPETWEKIRKWKPSVKDATR